MKGFEIIKGAINGAVNYTKKAVASTDFVQKRFVKPKLVERINERKKEQIAKINKRLELEAVKNSKTMTKLFKALKKEVVAFTDELKSDKNLDKICAILGKHVTEYDSAEAFVDAIKNSDSVEAIEEYLATAINAENYLALKQLLKKADTITEQETEIQEEVIESLNNGNLAKAVRLENKNINTDEIKGQVRTKLQELCDEMNFKNSEKDKLVAVFDKLATKFMPKFKKIRLALVKELPAALEAERDRILEACPHLAVADVETEEKALTTNYERKAKAETKVKEEKTQPTVNRKEKEKAEVKVKTEDEEKTTVNQKVKVARL